MPDRSRSKNLKALSRAPPPPPSSRASMASRICLTISCTSFVLTRFDSEDFCPKMFLDEKTRAFSMSPLKSAENRAREKSDRVSDRLAMMRSIRITTVHAVRWRSAVQCSAVKAFT